MRAASRCVLAVLGSKDLEKVFTEYPRVANAIREQSAARFTGPGDDTGTDRPGTLARGLSIENCERYVEMNKVYQGIN